ncbi:hypothetical protein P4200_01160 [Pseudomonas aeruginosa]|nr:hypothetical protein [Pseudomonas aeruginosa]
MGRAVLPRTLRARLPALESPPGTGRRQGRGAVAGARVFAIALLRTCALAGLIERLLASPQTRNLVHALTDHLRGNSLELDEQDSARRLEHPSTATRRPTSGSRTFPGARRRPAATGKAHRQRRRHAVAQPPARCRPRESR